MTTRTDSTEAMVSQLIRMVADLQVVVQQQGEAIQSQQESTEELAKVVMRNASAAWQRAPMSAPGGFPQ